MPPRITARNACVLAAATPGNSDAPRLLLAALQRGHRNSRADLERWLRDAGLRNVRIELSGAIAYFTATKPD